MRYNTGKNANVQTSLGSGGVIMPEAKNRLKEVRERELLSISQLARLSGVDPKTISRIEKGISFGTEITRRKILKGLNSNPAKTREYSYKDVFDIAEEV